MHYQRYCKPAVRWLVLWVALLLGVTTSAAVERYPHDLVDNLGLHAPHLSDSTHGSDAHQYTHLSSTDLMTPAASSSNSDYLHTGAGDLGVGHAHDGQSGDPCCSDSCSTGLFPVRFSFASPVTLPFAGPTLASPIYPTEEHFIPPILR